MVAGHTIWYHFQMSVLSHPFAITLAADEFHAASIARLLSDNPDANLRVLLMDGDERIHVAEEAGFFPVRKTWCGEVQLADIEIDVLAQVYEKLLSQGVEIGVLADDRLDEWLEAHERYYRRCHQANPLAPLDRLGRHSVFAGCDFRPEAAFSAILEDRVVAFASLRETAQGWEFGWFGAT